ncbi:MAG: FkbM family methyltransferase [Nanoarchaeota archaeon]
MSTLADIRTLIRCEKNWLIAKVPIKEKLAFLGRQASGIIKNSKKIKYLGRTLHYDRKWEPILIAEYPNEIEMITKKLDFKKIKNVLDIGANVGQWGITLKSYFPNIELYSFEPVPETFWILKDNSSKIKSWEVFNYGINEKDSNKKISYAVGASAEATYFKENINQTHIRKNVKEIDTKTINLKEKNRKKLSIPKNLSLVKIDVEGSEMEVLKGLTEINYDYLYIETSIGRRGSSIKEVVNFLEKNKKSVKVLFTHRPDKQASSENSLLEIKNKTNL